LAPAQPPKLRINLERAVVLVIDNALGLDILTSIFLGFGVRNLHRGRTLAEAKEILQTFQIDLIVMESLMPGEDAYEFIQFLRRSDQEENRFVPVVMLSAHTAASRVKKGRDCGANFLIGKPISAKVLIERILWVAREKRQFLETDSYIGPDRRFRDVGPPDAKPGRRRSDAQKADQSSVDVSSGDIS
jgi:DNA-binding response OmpR family regulator